MLRAFIVTLLYILPLLASAQKKQEISFHFRNGILLNKNDVRTTFGNRTITGVRNTLTQSVGGNYSRDLRQNIWLTTGIDIGYEYYKMNVVYPFEEYGYVKEPVLSSHYTEEAYIPFTDIHVSLGYRKTIRKIQPEIRIGQILHFPLREKVINTRSMARPVNGHRGNNFNLNGWYGRKLGEPVAAEFIGVAYLGVGIPSKMKNVRKVNLGLQFQRQLIGDHEQNYLSGTYNDGLEVIRSADVFRGTHTSISLVVGLVL